MQVEGSEIWTNIGLLVGGVMLAIAAYRGKTVPPAPRQQSEAVLADVGLELGNRDQQERMIHELKRIADAMQSLSDHRQANMQDLMGELLDKMRSAEKRS